MYIYILLNTTRSVGLHLCERKENVQNTVSLSVCNLQPKISHGLKNNYLDFPFLWEKISLFLEGKKLVHECDFVLKNQQITNSIRVSVISIEHPPMSASREPPMQNNFCQKADQTAFLLYSKPSFMCYLKTIPSGEILVLFSSQQTGFQTLCLDSKQWGTA